MLSNAEGQSLKKTPRNQNILIIKANTQHSNVDIYKSLEWDYVPR